MSKLRVSSFCLHAPESIASARMPRAIARRFILTPAREASKFSLRLYPRAICHILLKRRRSIHPQQTCFGTPRVLPTVWRGAFEIEAVSTLEPVVFFAVQPDFELTAKN